MNELGIDRGRGGHPSRIGGEEAVVRSLLSRASSLHHYCMSGCDPRGAILEEPGLAFEVLGATIKARPSALEVRPSRQPGSQNSRFSGHQGDDLFIFLI